MSWLALLVYQGAAAVAAVIALPFLLVARRGELAERLGGGPQAAGPSVWFHAASLGEFEAALPLLQGLSIDPSSIVVSCTNRVARARIAQRLPVGARARLAPFDLMPFVARALARERPACLIFVETEIWPAWLLQARMRGIPVAFVSARISDRSYPRYRRIAFILRTLLRSVTAIGCRTEEDRRRWIAIGAAPAACHVWGNTKYALTGRPAEGAARDANAPFVLVAGSVRRGEESLLKILSILDPRSIRLVLVPRHLREVETWEAACFRDRIPCRRLGMTGIDPDGPSELLARALRDPGGGIPTVLLADRIGVLRHLYGVADAAFVGGTWIPLGGHNLFEPAREGVPVFFGPSISGVRDAADAIEKYGGGRCVASPADLAAGIRELLDDPDALARRSAGARRAAEALAGAVARTVVGLREAGLPPAGRG